GGRGGRGGGNNANQSPTMPADDPSIPAERKNILDQLGIKEVRRGLNANQTTPIPSPGGPMQSNNSEDHVDEWPAAHATAITKPRREHASTKLPELLVMDDGKTKVTKDNWDQRKKELYEHFDRELYGRVPKDAPKITWTKDITVQGNVKTIRFTGTP